MIHRLRRYDAFASQICRCSTAFRNDAMFAQCAVRHTSRGVAVIIGAANIICREVRFANFGKHHSKNAPLSVDKSAFFVAKKRANGVQVYVKTQKRCVNIHRLDYFLLTSARSNLILKVKSSGYESKSCKSISKM